MFHYGSIRFQLLPGQTARVLDKSHAGLQRWAGPSDEAVDALDLDGLREKLIAHAGIIVQPDDDASCQVYCADAASPEPGKLYVRVWSDRRGPGVTTEFACSDALTNGEEGRMKAALAMMATHAGCPEHGNEPPQKPERPVVPGAN